jgi:hypothetical protein
MVMTEPREKFATQVQPSLLASVRSLAQQEGRQLQALIEEALTDLIEKRKNARPRPEVMVAYHNSHEKYAALYQKLAR